MSFVASLDAVGCICGVVSGFVTFAFLRSLSQPFAPGPHIPPILSKSITRFVEHHYADMRVSEAFAAQLRVIKEIEPRPTAAASFGTTGGEYRGQIIGMNLLQRLRYFVIHPDDVKHILVDNQTNYVKGKGYKVLRSVLRDGLFTLLEDDLHTLHRREVSSAFSPAALKRIANTTVRTRALELVRELNSAAGKSPTTIDMGATVKKTALAIIAEAAFRTEDKESTERVGDVFLKLVVRPSIFRILLPYGDKLFLGPTARRLRNEVQRCVNVTAAAVKAQGVVTDGTGKALIDYLLSSKVLSSSQVADHSTTFMFAGFDTTSNGLTWLLYLLATHATIQERLYEELCSCVGKGTLCEIDEIFKSSFLMDVIKEGLRLYPPAALVSREALKDDVLPGSKQFVPKGSTFVTFFMGMHRSVQLWGADADEFRPNRWREDATLAMLKRYPLAFVPFSAGRRSCIGKDFAMNELGVLVAALVRNFSFSWPEGASRPDRAFSIILHPKGPMNLIVEQRRE